MHHTTKTLLQEVQFVNRIIRVFLTKSWQTPKEYVRIKDEKLDLNPLKRVFANKIKVLKKKI
jgi:hypothetical protein